MEVDEVKATIDDETELAVRIGRRLMPVMVDSLEEPPFEGFPSLAHGRFVDNPTVRFSASTNELEVRE